MSSSPSRPKTLAQQRAAKAPRAKNGSGPRTNFTAPTWPCITCHHALHACRPHKPLIAVLFSDAKLTLYQYSPFRVRNSSSGEAGAAAASASPWHPSTPQECALLPDGASIESGSVSAAWGGRLQITLAVYGWQESPTAMAVPHPDAGPPVHIQCANLIGSPFCPPQSGFGCDPGSEPIDFRLSGGARPVGVFSMPDRLFRCVLLLLQLPAASGGGWIVRCVPAADSSSLQGICSLESKSIQLPPRPQPQQSALQPQGEHSEQAQGCLSPDGTMLAVLGCLHAGQPQAVVVLDIRDLQTHSGQGRIKVCTARCTRFPRALAKNIMFSRVAPHTIHNLLHSIRARCASSWHRIALVRAFPDFARFSGTCIYW